MPNMCHNSVRFTGDSPKIEEIALLFNAMALRDKEIQLGQLPPFIQSGHGRFYSIDIKGDLMEYWSKWTPNTGILIQIADHFQTGFVHKYSEPDTLIHGEATYHQGEFRDVYLTYEDFGLIEYDENGISFEGQPYDNEMEIMELLLERKKEPPEHSLGYKR